MNYKYNHFHLLVSDLDKTIGFLTNDIGAKLIAKKKYAGADGAALDLNGIAINLRLAGEGEKVNNDASYLCYGYHHLGFETDDIEASYKDLSSKGYEFFIKPKDFENLRIAFFRGPDNIIVELLQKMR